MTRNMAPVEPAQHARFFSLALDMLCIADFAGYFKLVNPSFGRTLGWSDEELLAQPFVELVHPDDREATIAATARLARGQNVEFVNRYRCHDGSYRWIEWRSSASVEEGLIYAAARDVTERKEAEEALRQQTQILQLILDSMSDGVLVMDESRKPVMLNRTAERMLGRTARELRTASDFPNSSFLYKPDQLTPFPDEELPLTRALRGEPSDNIEILVKRPDMPDGVLITSSGRPMHDASGTLRGAVVVLHDETGRRRAEQKLRLFTQAVQRMPIGIEICTLEDPEDPSSLTLAAYNQAAVAATGIPLDTQIGRRLTEVYQGTRAALISQYTDIVRTGQSRDFGIVEKESPGGVPQRYSVKGFPLSDRAMCILFENVTDRLRAQESVQIYQETVKHMQTGLLVLHLVDPENSTSLRILASNRAASRFTGVDLEASIGARLLDVFPNAVSTGLAQIYADVARTGQPRDLGEVDYTDERTGAGVFTVRAFAQPGSRVCVMFENVTDRKHAEQLIREQADVLLELSTPMIPITDDVMVMPLIGSVDVKRAQQVMETLLEGVARHQIRTVLLDITGVSVVDTHVASALIQAAQAVRLLGAEVVITGIRAEVAQSIVALGIDLKGLSTRSSLQSAIKAEIRRKT